MTLIDCVGNTPLVELRRVVARPGVRLLAKLEGNNPGGSVKDRAAVWMLRGAEQRGELASGIRIIEPTSGNTGIAMAMIARLRGYEIELVMPANATKERILTMQAYGACVTLTPQELSMEGAIDYVRAKAKEGGYCMINQFGNPDNPLAHYESTGPEIWRDTGGKITHFISAMGTTGTIMGVSRFLKEQNPAVAIVGVQPTEGTCIPGIRRWPAAYTPAIFQPERIDRIVDVSQEEAVAMTKQLAREEGILCGMSSGGAVAAAVQLCSEIERGIVVTVICDRGDRYLSSGLFG